MYSYSDYATGRRPIQFRGYGVDLKKWVFGSLVIDDDPTHVDSYPRIVSYKQSVRVEPESVGQFTGFYDEKGSPVVWMESEGGFNVDRGHCETHRIIGNRFNNIIFQ